VDLTFETFLQGGFIWDWMDQGLLKTNEEGQEYWAYGYIYVCVCVCMCACVCVHVNVCNT